MGAHGHPPLINHVLGGAALALVLFHLFNVAVNHKRTLEQIALEMSMMICVSLMILPVVWDHYYLWLIFPFYVLYQDLAEHFRVPRLLVCLAALVMVNLPTNLYFFRVLIHRHPQAIGIISGPFLGTCLVLALLHSALTRRTQT